MRRLLFLLMLLLTACATLPGGVRFDRGAMLRNLSENVALPLIDDAAAQSELLVESVHALRDAPSADTLAAARAQWQHTALAWERCEVVAFDADMSLLSRIDKYPTNEGFIESFIAEEPEITTEFVAGGGSTAKGLPALEYLLFDPEQEDDALLRSLENPARLAYLVATAETLRDDLTALQTFWSPDGENYVNTFANGAQADSDLQSSVSMSVNELVAVLEAMIQKELALPLGSRTYGEPFPTAAEGWRSGSSTANLLANLDGVQLLISGDSPSGEAGTGLDDYLDALGATHGDQPLSAALHDALAQSESALRAIERPLTVTVIEDRAAVEQARDALQSLLVLVKSDMASQLGVTITFNDSDGD